MEKNTAASKAGSAGSPGSRKADPAFYSQMRRHALEMRLPSIARNAVQIVLMDWHVDRGTVTVLASADGAASLYLSSGGGYVGGSEKFPSIRAAALHAVAVATSLQNHFDPTETSPLPTLGDVTFYITTGTGVSRAVAPEAKLRAGSDPLAALGGAMQKIVTEYRLKFQKPTAKAEPQ
ncbi:MAG: hypothetical protein ABSA94_05845 [Acidobacteriaceae bacterium]|jgi:hypothetical protein